MKILSIIIPTFNMEDYLPMCLNSLVDTPTISDLVEVLIINDGSKDSSSEIAHEYERKFPKTFRVVDKENGNYGSCINRGLQEASGKYVKVLDADDYFNNRSFSDFVKFLRNTDADLIISPYIKVDDEGKVLNKIEFDLPEKILMFSDEQLRRVFYSKHFQMHAVTYKTQLFKSLNYHQSEGISYTDQEWMFLPMTKVQTIAYFPQVLYCYLLGREGQTMDMKSQLRQIGHQMQGTLKMLTDYNAIGSGVNEMWKNYMVYRLNRRVSEIYKISLLYKLPQEDLIRFDSKIKDLNNKFYHQLDILTFHKFFPHHFIRYWHQHGKTSTIFGIYRFLKKYWKNY